MRKYLPCAPVSSPCASFVAITQTVLAFLQVIMLTAQGAWKLAGFGFSGTPGPSQPRMFTGPQSQGIFPPLPQSLPKRIQLPRILGKSVLEHSELDLRVL